MGKGRLEAFSDGVFAIAITLLALDLISRIPVVPRQTADLTLPHALVGLLPGLVSYIISFVLVSVCWTWHHGIFRFIRKYDIRLVVLNNSFLLCVALVPFPAALFGHYPNSQTAFVIYMGFFALTMTLGALVWIYAAAGRRFIPEDLDGGFVRYIAFRGLAPALAMSLGMTVALFDRQLAIFGVLAGILATRLIARFGFRGARAHAASSAAD